MRSIGGGGPVECLRADLDELVAVDVVALPDAVVRSDLQHLMAARNQLDAAIASRLASFDTRNLADDDACRTSAVWLRSYARCSDHAASGLVKRARLLADLPAVAEAAARGEVSAEHVDRISELAKHIGVEAVQPADQILADAASKVNVAELKVLCHRIRDYVDPDGPEPMEAFEKRELTLSKLRGMVMVRGQLDPEGGVAVQEALDALMKPPAPDDLRTPGQRRADALVDLARRALADGDLPTVGGMRPQVGILLSPSTLLYGEDGNDPHTRVHVPFGDTEAPDIGNLFDIDSDGDRHHGDSGGDGTSEAAETGKRSGPAPADTADTADTADGLERSGPAPTDIADSDERSGPAPADTADGLERSGPAPTDSGAGASGGATARSRGDPAPPGDPLAARGIPPPIDAWLNWYGPIPPAVAKRIACDSDIWRIVLDPTTGLPLDVGRAHRLVPWWIRRAL